MDISQIEQMLNNFDIDNLPYDDDNDNDLLSELDDIVYNSSRSKASHSNPMEPEISTSPKRPISSVSSNQTQIEPKQIKIPKVDAQYDINVAPLDVQSQLPPSNMPHQTQLQEKIPFPNTSNQKEQQIAQIKQLQIEYKKSALKAKTSGDKESAIANLKISKVFNDCLILLRLLFLL